MRKNDFYERYCIDRDDPTIAEAVKKLPPDQRKKVSVETARASTF